MRPKGTRVYTVTRMFGLWACLFQTVTGGICFITAKWIDEIIQQITEVNRELADIIADIQPQINKR